MANNKQKSRLPSHRLSGLKSNNTSNDNQFNTHEQEANIKALVREYTILNDRINTEHSSSLTVSQRDEEQKLRADLFNMLHAKGVAL